MSQLKQFQSIIENFLKSSEYSKNKELIEEQYKKVLEITIKKHKVHFENHEKIQHFLQEHHANYNELNNSLFNIKKYDLTKNTEIQQHFNNYFKAAISTNLSLINKQIDQLSNNIK